MIGIHPGLHAEGVYEFWEPTLDLLLDKNVKTAFTVLSEEEYVQVSYMHLFLVNCPILVQLEDRYCTYGMYLIDYQYTQFHL